jgi:hypothetical protein
MTAGPWAAFFLGLGSGLLERPDSLFKEPSMRALVFCLIGLTVAASSPAIAQMKLSPKASPGAIETRYFTAIDGLMGGDADVILKETRQGKTLTAAVLDVCYPVAKGSGRKDRFVANLAVNGQNLTGATQTLVDKLPVTINLVRKPTGDSFEFKGQIGVGQTVTQVSSPDNSDLSEQEFRDNQSTDDSINAAPRDFTEVSPESVAVKLKLDTAADFLKSLKGEKLELSLNSLTVSCDALRAGEQTITLAVDPERAAQLIAKAKSAPGVVAAGWTAGVVDMERAIRFPAAEWRDGERLNRDKLAAGIGAVLAKTFSAKPASAQWNENTGKLKLMLKRPSQIYPALELTDIIEVEALVSSERPGASDHLMLWVGNPSVTTADETAGPKLNLANASGSDEEGDQFDDNGSVDALAREFKGQRWNSDKSAWK